MLNETLSKKALLEHHIGAIRSHHLLCNVPIYFIPESNLGEEAAHMSAWVDSFPHVTVPRWSKDGGLGVETTEHSKVQGFNLVDGILSHHGFRFMERFIVSNPYQLSLSTVDEPHLRASTKKEFITQMARLRYWIETPKKIGAKPHVHVSGKCNDAGVFSSKINDDLSIAFLINVNAEHRISRTRSSM